MQAGGGIEAGGLTARILPRRRPGEGFDEPQQLQQAQTPARRRNGQYRVAAEADRQGFHQPGSVGAQIAGLDQAAALLHQGEQRLGHGPLVEARLAGGGDAAEGGGQFALAQRVARLQGKGVGAPRSPEEQAAGAGVGPQHRRRGRQGLAQGTTHRETPLRQLDRRRQHRLAGETAVAALGQQQAGDAAGHSGGPQAAGGQGRIDATVGPQEQGGARCPGGGLPEVHRRGVAATDAPLRHRAAPRRGGGGAGQPEEQEAATAQVAGVGEGHRLGESGGHGRIHRVAAAPQHRGPHRHRLPLFRRHDPAGGADRLEALPAFGQHIGGSGARPNQDRSGQDRSGQHRSGQDRSDRDRTGVHRRSGTGP
jgi:hypothetical protein